MGSGFKFWMQLLTELVQTLLFFAINGKLLHVKENETMVLSNYCDEINIKMNATVFAKTTQLCLKPAKQNHIMILQKCSICFLGRESCRKTIKTQSSLFGVCQTKLYHVIVK